VTDHDDDMPAVPGTIVGITIFLTCPCGSLTEYEAECHQDDFGVWSVPMEEQFDLCESCGQVVDAGVRITAGAPE
jgi:hypothetical protein